MRKIILCEGIDDIHFLGYYLYKTNSWQRIEKNSEKEFSDYYKFPRRDNYKVEFYKKDDKRLALWSVGGKNIFKGAFKFIEEINSEYGSEYGISKVFLIRDRDNDKVENTLQEILEEMKENKINLENIKNNTINCYNYTVEDKVYTFEIFPIIIPFEEEGALETVLINGIREMGEQEEYIVNKALEYVNNFIDSNRISNYLNHERLKLKAKFSSIISIINPEHSTKKLNDILIDYPWEKNEEIKKHFKLLDKI